MSLYKTDVYLSEYAYPIDAMQMDALIYLYEPLMGGEAYTLYNLLYTEAKRMDRYHVPCPLERLVSFSNASLDQLEVGLKKLEAIGLLRTYKKIEENHTLYLYRVHNPLTFRSFFKNQILSTLLLRSIGKEEFIKTRDYFRIAGEDKREYEDVTAKFNDVYEIQLSEKHPLKTNLNYFHNKEADFRYEYDLTLFNEAMADYQIPKNVIEPYMSYITQLATVYSVDALTLASLVRESIKDNKFDRVYFKKKCISFYNVDSSSKLEEVYTTQPEQYKSGQNKNDALSKHLTYLESISPYELLKSKQGGKEPVLHDLAIAETLMTQLNLTPGVTNVLIEYVLGKNDNTLSRSYCETIGASWSRKHIKSAREAYEAAIGETRVAPHKETKPKQSASTPVKKKPKPAAPTSVDEDAVMKMIEELRDEE